ncbi:MAG: hypothetical protein RLZZ408_1168, partial [Verrucomicrobiota bacterium]
MADGRLNCHKPGPEDGNNQPFTMKTNKKAKGRVKRLRLAEGAQAGREALAALRKFLKERNAAALASLEESGERLIALHLL